MSSVAESQGALSKNEADLQEKRKAAKRQKREMQKRKKRAKIADAEFAATPGSKPEIQQEQLECPTDADAIMEVDSESEWEGFPDLPTPAAHIAASKSEADTLDSKDAGNVKPPVKEGKNGITALQESIAHQFPGDPRPATHALMDLLLDLKITDEFDGLAVPSQPGLHTIEQLATVTRLWFEKYRNKNVVLGIVLKNKNPIIDTFGDHRKTGTLWIKSSNGNFPQPGEKPARFSGIQFVPADVREHEKKYTKTNKDRH
ncbi:uncharacterized protein ColSpa_07302 [Colletotrichum spaethianum]|uniref:Uncharacterized protein n=1 Tax=Colletotrichum spaethianum TaxID=700344 RepID=A0AA37P6R3_9PEZI|nr:uncharacterized protein ColSpa_07302 [Colletotrichum spaethianum]GKT47121.1 hypothetical protein ColSpa_07302 [Colletotrichum spaethianum]